MYTAALHLLYSSFRWGRWVIVGCYNGSRKKRLKFTDLKQQIQQQHAILAFAKGKKTV